jgi:predicted acyltransferase
MVIGDYIAGINWIPDFLKHAPDMGFTIADTVAPLFVFVIGLNFAPSFRHRFRENSSTAYRYFIQRYLSLIGIGAIITAGSALANRPTGWGVLESLGVGGLLTLLVIRLPIWARLPIGLLMLIVYQYFLDTSMLQSVLNSGHGGFFGAISWSALLILSTAVADIWRKGKVAFAFCNLALIAAGAFSALVVPVSKNRVSLSYILISLALSALVFLVVKTFSKSNRLGLFCWWGQHSLGMYLLHLLVLSLFGLPPIPWWYVEAPLWLMALQIIAILTFMSLFARWLNSRKHSISAR